MAHREGIRTYLSNIDLSGKTVVDWGCGTKPIKNYLPGAARYLGIDILGHVGADIVHNLNNPIHIGEHDVAFCLEVMEHVEDTSALLKNIYENLSEGGVFYFSVPFMYPVHSDHDLWRFTDQGLRYLLIKSGFKVIDIKPTTPDYEGWVGLAIK